MRGLQSAAAGASGQIRKARRLSQQANDLSREHDLKEAAAGFVAGEADLEASVGNLVAARKQANAALAASHGLGVEMAAAFALADAGDLAQARRLVEDLNKRSPLSTLVNKIQVPIILAMVEMRGGRAAQAVELLEEARPYELGEYAGLTPGYVRGEAYLQMRDGGKAEEEFQKIVDHRGLDPFDYARANLSLARAYALQKDMGKARARYQDFFALWKDADPDVPVLKQAKAEYAKLPMP